ncbi:MAG: type II toxin-antitoxin system VapC family toxin [Armatimonadota bacterium]|nr:type II toxin-antitoxin system VapC family toxin [Armatimonadota bacterium]
MNAAPYVVLDTDAASHAQRGTLPPALQSALVGRTPCITFVSVGEFYKGAYKAGWGSERLARLEEWMRNVVVLPYDAGVARTWGYVAAQLEKQGLPISENDVWIAACCIRHGLPLITLNRAHFARIPELEVLP